ncbi:MAG: ATP synthase F1 subunit gamma [Deferribacterota bacterium]|nr:ATP synthase F1 subunit gamma [Deferribacterota bacterium]
MRSTKDIKRKINSIKNTQKITKAMKMVAAAKLRRAQSAFDKTKPYADSIRKMTNNLAYAVEDISHPYFYAGTSAKKLFVVVTSDRGLCGAFNSNILKMFNNISKDYNKKDLIALPVGRVGYNALTRNNFEVVHPFTNYLGKIFYNDAKKIASNIKNMYIDGEIGEVNIIYNTFKSIAVQQPTCFKLLPVELVREDEFEQASYIFEPAPEKLLSDLVERYVDFTIYNKLLESTVGEHGSRMVAMDNATRSAGDMINRYILSYNKARQAAITTEILDIVNCSEALNK